MDIPNANDTGVNNTCLYLTAVRFGRVPKREKAKILAAMQSSRMKTQESKVMGELNDDAKIIDCIVRAHYDTCDYTRKKMEPFLQRAKASPKYISCSGTVSPSYYSPAGLFGLYLSSVFVVLCYQAGLELEYHVAIGSSCSSSNNPCCISLR